MSPTSASRRSTLRLVDPRTYLLTGGQGTRFHIANPDPAATPRDDTLDASLPSDAPVSYCRRRGTIAAKPEDALVCGKCAEKDSAIRSRDERAIEKARAQEAAAKNANERQRQRLARAKALAAPLPHVLRCLFDAAMAEGHLWGRGNSNGYGEARVHLIQWAPNANHATVLSFMNIPAVLERDAERVAMLFQGYNVEATCRRAASIEPPPGGSEDFDFWSMPRELSDEDKRSIRERYAAEMLHWIEVDGESDAVCSMCWNVAMRVGII